MAPYPWIAANVGDVDITGFRRPVSYWREIVWGLRDAPYLAVRPPAHHGEESTFRGGWSFTDAIASWSWAGFEGKAISVEVYADADEVELVVNGESSGRAKVGASHPFVAEFETTYSPGEVVAVAYREGTETVASHCPRRPARRSSTSVSIAPRSPPPTAISPSSTSRWSTRRRQPPQPLGPRGDRDRRRSSRAARLRERQSVHRGDLWQPTHDTFNGRALAVIRPTGPGTITVTASTKDADDRTVTIEAAHL